MSVLVKGTDMPKNCDECPFAEAVAELYCNSYVLSLEERPEWCPLHEVPEDFKKRNTASGLRLRARATIRAVCVAGQT